MRDFYNEHKEKADKILFLLLVTVTVYLFFTVFLIYLAPFIIGLLIALILEPLNGLLVKKLGFKRGISSFLCLLLFIIVIGSLGAWLVGTIVRQASIFIENAPSHIAELSAKMHEANLWLEHYTERLPEGLYLPYVQEMLPAAFSLLVGDGMRETGMRTIGNVSDYSLNILLGLISAYFFMSDGKTIFRFVKRICPEWLQTQARNTKTGLLRALVGYFRAEGILMVMTGAISIIGLLFMRSPYALMLGILFAVLDFLPVLGPALVILPWALVSVIMGNMHQALGLMVIYGIITIARQVLQPKILGSQMGAHPLASLMAIYIGFRVFGVLGLLIGPSLLMVVVAISSQRADKARKSQV
ncbi:MAG: sporulation integral membrane protein YtvI [Defluviitaleaceae bacterium]|nr:sporulation integral membrane protein YtvI [Defluviitaleaceae bacterium]